MKKNLFLLLPIIQFFTICAMQMDPAIYPPSAQIIGLVRTKDETALKALVAQGKRFTETKDLNKTPVLALPFLTAPIARQLIAGHAQPFLCCPVEHGSTLRKTCLQVALDKVKETNSPDSNELVEVLAEKLAETAIGREQIKAGKEYVLKTFGNRLCKKTVLQKLNQFVPSNSGNKKKKENKGPRVAMTLQHYWRTITKADKKREDEEIAAAEARRKAEEKRREQEKAAAQERIRQEERERFKRLGLIKTEEQKRAEFEEKRKQEEAATKEHLERIRKEHEKERRARKKAAEEERKKKEAEALARTKNEQAKHKIEVHAELIKTAQNKEQIALQKEKELRRAAKNARRRKEATEREAQKALKREVNKSITTTVRIALLKAEAARLEQECNELTTRTKKIKKRIAKHQETKKRELLLNNWAEKHQENVEAAQEAFQAKMEKEKKEKAMVELAQNKVAYSGVVTEMHTFHKNEAIRNRALKAWVNRFRRNQFEVLDEDAAWLVDPDDEKNQNK